MNEGVKQQVDTSSAEFEEGVEAGLNSAEDTKNWKAGNELGHELRDERERKGGLETLVKESSTPLFIKDAAEGNRGNEQDEKDETEE